LSRASDATGRRFIRVDESRDLPLLHVVEDFTRNRYAALLLRREEIKIDSAAPAVDGGTDTPSGH
jgi:hypothetical protein